METTTRRIPVVLVFMMVLLAAGVRQSNAQVTVTIPDVFAGVGEQVTIPVNVSDLTGRGVLAYTVEITYDPAILSITSVQTAGTLSASATVVPNTGTAGRVRVAAAAGNAFAGSGALFNLRGTVLAAGSSDLTFNLARLEAISGVVESEATAGVFSTSQPNRAPTATNVAVTTDEDRAVTITLAGADLDGTALQFAISSEPTNGSLSAVTVVNATSATVTYTPDENFSGSDTFQFTVSDGELSATGTATVTVTAVNDTPVAAPDDYDVEEDAVLTVDAENGVLSNDTDVDSENLTVVVVTNATHGTLVLNPNGSFTYTPDADFSGTESFTYRVSDGSATATAAVTITVAGIDDAPSASTITSPSADAQITIGGGPGEEPVGGDEQLLTVRWTESTDPEGEEVSYEYQLAASADFANVLFSRTFDTNAGFDLTVAETAQIFDQATVGMAPGTPVMLHHRVVTRAGDLERVGAATTLTLTRGTIVGTEAAADLPEAFALHGNYPNPFNPVTTLRFDLPETAEVRLEVFDMVGRQVMTLPARRMQAGRDIAFHVDAAGLVSGTYLYRLTVVMASATEVGTGKLVLLK